MQAEISWSAQPEISLVTGICRSDGKLVPDNVGRIGNGAPNRRGQAVRIFKVKACRIGRPTQLYRRTSEAAYRQPRYSSVGAVPKGTSVNRINGCGPTTDSKLAKLV